VKNALKSVFLASFLLKKALKMLVFHQKSSEKPQKMTVFILVRNRN
jgi:hypothetical protein